MKSIAQSLWMSSVAVLFSTQAAFAFGPKPVPVPVYTGTPVVLAPGLLIPLTSYDDPKIKAHFSSRGYEFVVAQQLPSGSVEARADKLCSEIKRLVPTGAFHIMAISMGGLDSRRAIQKCGLGDRVISLTTVSTPHRGTPLADGATPGKPGLLKDLGDSLYDLSTARAAAFNDSVLDDSRVKYFSIGFMIPEPVSTSDLLTWFMHKTIKDKSGQDNDSMVGVDSANWGTYLGTLEGSHMAISVANKYNGGFIYEATYEKVLENLSKVDRK